MGVEVVGVVGVGVEVVDINRSACKYKGDRLGVSRSVVGVVGVVNNDINRGHMLARLG